MDELSGKLQASVEYIQSDMAEVKAQARATNAKIDDARKEVTSYVSSTRTECLEKLDGLRDHMLKSFRDSGEGADKLRVELTERIDVVRNRIDGLQAEMLRRFEQVDLRMQLVQSELTRQIDQLKESLYRAKIQNLWWYISLGGAFFYIVAHALKWL